MSTIFYTKAYVNAPAACLIEDYQVLQRVLRNLGTGNLADAREDISSVMECIAEVIEKYQSVPDDVSVKLSPSTVIAPSCFNGILVHDEDRSDIKCAAGKPVSNALLGGVCQCSMECMAEHNCNPEEYRIQLENQLLYDGSMDSQESIVAGLDAISLLGY